MKPWLKALLFVVPIHLLLAILTFAVLYIEIPGDRMLLFFFSFFPPILATFFMWVVLTNAFEIDESGIPMVES